MLPADSSHTVQVIDNHTFELTVTHHAKLSIEVNGNIDKPLFLFYNPLQQDAFPFAREGDLVFEGGKRYEVGKVELEDGRAYTSWEEPLSKGHFFAREKQDIQLYGMGILDGTGLKRSRPAEEKPHEELPQLDQAYPFRQVPTSED